jgi:hypothetical protein
MAIGYGEVVPGRRLPELAAFVVAVLGIAMGLLFAPIQGGCMTTATSTVPGQIATPGPTVCTNESLVARQSIWPLPFLAVAAWSVAPLISYVGVRRKMAGERSAIALIIFALVLEASVLISFGAAPLFAPFVLLPLVISTALALSARVDQRST